MRLRHSHALCLALPSLLVIFGASACLDDSEEFRAAPPSADELKITAPSTQAQPATSGQSTQALTGTTSEFYEVTWAISADLNTRAAILLGLMRLSTIGTPSARTINSRTWGPYTPGGLDPLTYQVVVTKTAPGQFTYSFEARPKAQASAAFSPLVTGDITRDTSGAIPTAKGNVTLHFDALRALRSDACEVGEIRGEFDTTKSPASIDIYFDQFANDNASNVACKKDAPRDAYYHFDRGEGGAGDFVFSTPMNVNPDSANKPALETVSIHSRWLATGEGRSDVRVEGGEVATDLTALTPNASTNFLSVSQCWSRAFVTSYETATPAALGLYVTNGDPTSCAFTSAELPE